MRHFLSRTLAVTSAVAAIAALCGAGPQAQAQSSSSEVVAQLAEKYRPIVMVAPQDEPCDDSGEPFAPMPVEAVLGNPQVALRQSGESDPVVKWGPTAADLFGRSEGFYLDFPGLALEQQCVFERDHVQLRAEHAPTVYAHVATEEGEEDRLALQYWFFWYYNDWNNKHEGDWEGIQLIFEASTVEEALAEDPVAVGFAQHEGGERADWTDDKLEREGTRPVVYPSRGSHATYFGAALYLGRSGSEGFGCDVTENATDRLDPEVVVVPDDVTGAADPLAWLSFEGRWGERHAGPWNGPTGLRDKDRWSEPMTWQAGLRDASVSVPTGSNDVVNFFCAASEVGSYQVMKLLISPWRVIAVVTVLFLLARWLLRRTSWEPTAWAPVVARRRAGQLLRAAAARYRATPGRFVLLGLVAIPVAIAAAVLLSLVRLIPFVGDVLTLTDRGSGARLILSVVTGGLVVFVTSTVVTAAVAAALTADDRGETLTARQAMAAVNQRRSDVLGALVRILIPVALMYSTVLLAPVALFLAVRWLFAPQAVMADGLAGSQALGRSARLVRGRWWHTLVVFTVITSVVLFTGSVAGLLALLVAQSLPLWSISIIVSLAGAVLLPFGAIATTLLYGDAVADSRHVEEPTPVVV